MRVLLYAKMLKGIDETIGFFVTFLSLVAFKLEGVCPPDYGYTCSVLNKHTVAQCIPSSRGGQSTMISAKHIFRNLRNCEVALRFNFFF